MKLTDINKLRAYTRNEFDSNGDIVYLTIKINDELKELLKKACVLNIETINDSFRVGTDDEGETKYFTFDRYKAKTIFYRDLNTTSKNVLYSVLLLTDGVLKIPFYKIYSQTEFLENFQRELKTLTELLIGENIEREISFNLATTETD